MSIMSCRKNVFAKLTISRSKITCCFYSSQGTVLLRNPGLCICMSILFLIQLRTSVSQSVSQLQFHRTRYEEHVIRDCLIFVLFNSLSTSVPIWRPCEQHQCSAM